MWTQHKNQLSTYLRELEYENLDGKRQKWVVKICSNCLPSIATQAQFSFISVKSVHCTATACSQLSTFSISSILWISVYKPPSVHCLFADISIMHFALHCLGCHNIFILFVFNWKRYCFTRARVKKSLWTVQSVSQSWTVQRWVEDPSLHTGLRIPLRASCLRVYTSLTLT